LGERVEVRVQRELKKLSSSFLSLESPRIRKKSSFTVMLS